MSEDRKLAEHLRDPLDEASLQRVWTQVQRRRAQRSRPWLWLVPALAVAALALFFVLPSSPEAPAGEFTLHTGGSMTLSDGARVAVQSGQVEIGARKEGVRASVGVGKARFELPAGRAWTLDCGQAELKASGASFEVVREEAGLRVSVSAGQLEVSGPRLAKPVVLGAGQGLEVSAPEVAAAPEVLPATPRRDRVVPPPAPASPLPSAPPPTKTAVAPAVPLVTPKSPRPKAPRVRPARPAAKPVVAAARSKPAARASKPEPVAAAPKRAKPEPVAPPVEPEVPKPAEEPAKPKPKPATMQALLARADAARLSGRHGAAAAALEEVLAKHGRSPGAALAAFSLGRLYLERLSRPAAAVRAFKRALASGAPAGLVEDAYARLVEANVRAGDHVAARAATERYRRRFPRGRRLADIERALSP